MPMLAFAYDFLFEGFYLVNKDSEMKDEQVIADVPALPAGLKAYATSYTTKSLSVCREACGGMAMLLLTDLELYIMTKIFSRLLKETILFCCSR